MAWYDELGAGTLGAVDEALFGLPEWVAKQVNRKGVEDYIKKHETAYRIGETAGTIGSMFIPVGGLAKGAFGAGKAALGLAKGAKAADTALDLVRAGDTALDIAKGAKTAADAAKAAKSAESLTRLAAKGALSGALESGVRGFTSEKTPEEMVEALKSGALWGGAGGAVAGGISKALPMIGKLAKKSTEKAIMGTTNARMRDILRMSERMTGGGAGYQLANADDLRRGFTDFIKKGNLGAEGNVEKAYETAKQAFKTYDSIFDATVGNAKAAKVLEGVFQPEQLAKFAEDYGDDVVKKATNDIMAQVGNKTGAFNTRDALNKLADRARKLNTGDFADQTYADAVYDLSKSMLKNLDDAVIDTAQKAGVDIPKNFKRDWGFLQPVAKGELRDEFSPSKFNLGSPTFEKAAIGSLMGGTSFFTNPEEDIGKKLATAGISAAAGAAGQKLISAGLRKGVSKLDDVAALLMKATEKAAPKSAQELGDIASLAGRASGGALPAAAEKLGKIPQQEKQEKTDLEPSLMADAQETGASAGSKDKANFMQNVESKLRQRYFTEYAPVLGDSEEAFNQFAGNVYQLTGGFNPEKMANVLYTDPEERKQYQQALSVSKKIQGGLGGAVAYKSKMPILGFLGDIGKAPEAQIEEESGYRALQSVLSEAIKAQSPGISGSEKLADKQLSAILSGGGSMQEKQAMLENVLTQYGVNVNMLKEVGLI